MVPDMVPVSESSSNTICFLGFLRGVGLVSKRISSSKTISLIFFLRTIFLIFPVRASFWRPASFNQTFCPTSWGRIARLVFPGAW